MFAPDVFAQTTRSKQMQREIFRTFHSRVYSGQYPMPEVPVAARPSFKCNDMKSLPHRQGVLPQRMDISRLNSGIYPVAFSNTHNRVVRHLIVK